jgi:hypothetical protein
MKVVLLGSYVSKKGNDVFRYAVSGTPAQLEAFKAAQGDNHRVDEATGKPLWFTTRCIGDTGTLLISQAGKVVPDMSAYKKAASLSKQFGGNFGQELARAAVAQLLGGGTSVSEPEAVAANSGIEQM